MNPMKKIRIEKITLNIGTGKPGPELEKAKKLLKAVTGEDPVETKTKKRIPTWSLRPGLAIGTKVTLRGKKAEEVLKTLIIAVENVIPERKIGKDGNFAFGIKEYIDIPGIEYDASIGIIGLEVAVTLQRAGFRIKNRHIRSKKIPQRHRISREETKQFLTKSFNVKFNEGE